MLTRKQLDCYNAIKDYRARNGVSPSYRELMGVLELKSISNVHRLVTALEDRGVLVRIPHCARAFRLLDLPK